jgi:hypothetical protein
MKTENLFVSNSVPGAICRYLPIGHVRAWSLIMPPQSSRSLIVNRFKTGSKQKRSKYSVRLDVAANLIAAYVECDSQERFEGFLASQVYGEQGMYSYRAFPEDPLELQAPPSTHEHPLLVEAWSNWAQNLRESCLNDFERREAVRGMLGAVIQKKDRKRLTGLELREAAKTTLGWTKWDAKHLRWYRQLGHNSIAEHSAWCQKVLGHVGTGTKYRGTREVQEST